MRVDIIIPWQDSCPYRSLAFGWIINAYRLAEFQVVVGELDPDETWSKAVAVKAGLKKSVADVIVIADADCWTFGLTHAIDEVLSGAPWAIPFRDVHRLSPEATSVALRDGDLDGKLQQRPYLGVLGGGMTVITRENYESVPLDPRFRGWGQEDEAWGMALQTMLGKGFRGSEPLYHLWHPPQPRQNRAVGSDASRALRNQYQRARPSAPAMERILTDAKAAR